MEGTGRSKEEWERRSGLWVKQLALSFNVCSALPAQKGQSTPTKEKAFSYGVWWGTTYLGIFCLCSILGRRQIRKMIILLQKCINQRRINQIITSSHNQYLIILIGYLVIMRKGSFVNQYEVFSQHDAWQTNSNAFSHILWTMFTCWNAKFTQTHPVSLYYSQGSHLND